MAYTNLMIKIRENAVAKEISSNCNNRDRYLCRIISLVLAITIVIQICSAGIEAVKTADLSLNAETHVFCAAENSASNSGKINGLTEEADIDLVFVMSKAVTIYDSSELDRIIEDRVITIGELYSTIDGNPNIIEKFRPLVKEFCRSYITYAPKADRRILLLNLGTLTVTECSEMEMILHSWSTTACACYDMFANTVYLPEDEDFTKGTWGYQMVFHELSHTARILYGYEKDGVEYKAYSGGYHYSKNIIAETLNTVFSCSLLGYDEPDLAYQLQSNYMYCILNSLNNYELSDYINHSQSYLIYKIDEYTGRKGYTEEMFELLEKQYNDYHNEDFLHIDTPQLMLYPLYDFIADIYYKDRVTSDMTYSEAVEVKDELVDRITFDVPEEYGINTSHFDRYLKSYCKNIGIEI